MERLPFHAGERAFLSAAQPSRYFGLTRGVQFRQSFGLVISPTSTARAPVFAVVVHEKGGAERRESFETSELTVGRVQGNELMLPKGNVSKRHARLLYRDGRFIVTDLNSTNGTYVNRRRITQATIVREGDRIYVGDFVLRIELPGADAGAAGVEGSARAEPVSATDEVSATAPSPGAANVAANLRRLTHGDDDEIRTPAPRAALEASPALQASAVSDAAPRPGSLSGSESTGTRPAGRTTQDDSPSYERSALTRAVQAAVQAVFERLGADVFEGPMDADACQRAELALREVVDQITTTKDAPFGAAPERVLELARDELLELGPLGDLMADPSVGEIGVVRYDQVVAARGGRSFVADQGFSSERALGWAALRLRAAAVEGGSALEFNLPGGARVSMESADRGRPAALLIRKVERLALTLDELVRRGAISRAMATFFRHCLVGRVNLLIVGGHDGAAEQVLAALVGSQTEGHSVWVGEAAPSPADVSVEFGTGNVLEARRALALKAGIPGARLVARLSTPELAAAVSEVVASGADGVLAVRRAPSARRGLLRLAVEIAAARPGFGIQASRELIAGAFDVVVEVARLRDDRVRVLRVAELTCVKGDEIELGELFTFVPDRTAAGGAVEGTFSASGHVPQVVESMRARGENLDSSLFSRPPSR